MVFYPEEVVVTGEVEGKPIHVILLSTFDGFTFWAYCEEDNQFCVLSVKDDLKVQQQIKELWHEQD